MSTFGVQLLLVSATYPREMTRILGDFIDTESLEVIQTDSLHRVLPHVKQRFIRLHKYDRDAALLRIVSAEVAKEKPVIIFSNRTPMSNWIHGFMRQNEIDCLKLNKSLTDLQRLDTFDRFQSGDCDVLSCTDLASRGLDTVRVCNLFCAMIMAYLSFLLRRVTSLTMSVRIMWRTTSTARGARDVWAASTLRK